MSRHTKFGTCQTCIFKEDGRCYRFPPVPVQSIEVENLISSWNGDFQGMEIKHDVSWLQPKVNPDEWCGEYRFDEE